MENRLEIRAKVKIQRAVLNLKERYKELLFPLSQMEWEKYTDLEEEDERNLSTDGIHFMYSPWYVNDCSVKKLEYEIMHILMHGLLGHFSCKDDYVRKDCRDALMDAQVLYTLVQLGMREERLMSLLKDTTRCLSGDFSMGQYYKTSVDKIFLRNLLIRGENIKVDSHEAWDSEKEVQEFWKMAQGSISEMADGDWMEEIGRELGMSEKGSADNEYVYNAGEWEVKNYKELLRKLFQINEVMREIPDSIDPMLYRYGLTLYGDVPLIEPLESGEEVALHTLAIAVDVSGSCFSERIMQRFWDETYGCLEQVRDLIREGEIILLQCDAEIKREERMQLSEFVVPAQDVCVEGGGGTDFRPVFERLNQLQEERKVDALIYFTDGQGVYPEEKPEYPVYFVMAEEFLEECGGWGTEAPEWIMKIRLEGAYA